MSERGFEYLTGPSKRRLDFIGGMAIGTLASPFGGMAAVAAGLDTRSSPIFKQTRVGHNGNVFNIWKLRTLAERHINGDSQTYGTHDPRASIAGLALRKLGLDELPQMVNVIKGDMSLVGLRPILVADMERLHDLEPKMFADWLEVYLATKPGVTGPGQVYRKLHAGPDDSKWIDAMKLDLEYSENANLLGDMHIIAQTPIQLLKTHLSLPGIIQQNP